MFYIYICIPYYFENCYVDNNQNNVEYTDIYIYVLGQYTLCINHCVLSVTMSYVYSYVLLSYDY